ncbi:hypothetical protein ACFLQ8_03455 [Candidatus Auribacterota bacterium]
MEKKTISILIIALAVLLGISAVNGLCEEKDEGQFLDVGDSIRSQEDANEEEASMPFFRGEMLEMDAVVPVPENIEEVEKKAESAKAAKVKKAAAKKAAEEKKEELEVAEDIKSDMPPVYEQTVKGLVEPEKKPEKKPEPKPEKPAKKEKKKEAKASVKPAPRKEKELKKKTAEKDKVKDKAIQKKAEKKKKDLKKAAKKKTKTKLPDLVITKVVSRPVGAGEKRELLITIGNTGKVSAPPEQHGEDITVIVKTGGGPAARQMRLQRQIMAGGKIVVSSGKYPKKYIEGKKVMIMINYTGKEKKRENNIWNKPAIEE